MNQPLQRARGYARAHFERTRRGGTALITLEHQSPCRLLLPREGGAALPTGVLLTTTGGLTGGDVIQCRFSAGPGARVRLTTQAAEKIYRARADDPPATVEAELHVAAGAWLEWVPQEAILFDRCALRRKTTLHVHPEGRTLAAEMVILGRLARGERWAEGLLDDRWAVYVGGALRWLDALRLDGGALLDHPQAFAGARALATAIYSGADAAERRPALREALRGALDVREGAFGGLTAVNGLLIARLMGPDAAAVRAALADYLATARALLADLPEAMPRVWNI